MIESLAAIGVGGALMLLIGYVGLFYMARLVNSRDPYEEEGDTDE